MVQVKTHKPLKLHISFPDPRDIFAPVLSDRTIVRMMHRGKLITTPINVNQLQPNSVDLTLADTWSKPLPNTYHGNPGTVTEKNAIRVDRETKYRTGEFERSTGILGMDPRHKPWYTIMPGEFVLMASREELNIPNGILAFVQGRSSMARLSIQTEQAGLIDAGFKGTITFEVFNEGEYPLTLFSGMRVAQLYFFRAQRASIAYGLSKGSKYSGQIVVTGSKIHMDPELRGC